MFLLSVCRIFEAKPECLQDRGQKNEAEAALRYRLGASRNFEETCRKRLQR